MKKKIIALGLFVSLSALAKECIVISGAKDDPNGALERDGVLHLPTSDIGAFRCRLFDTWKEAAAYVDQLKPTGPRDQLLVIQGAHGSPGGGAHFNGGGESGTNILRYLNQFATRFHVGFVAKTCYSGDLLINKIADDVAQNRDPAHLANLCMVTSAVPGRVSANDFYAPLMRSLGPKDNLQELFVEKEMPMSSFPWSQTGFGDYLNKKESAEQTLQKFLGLFKEMNQEYRKHSEWDYSHYSMIRVAANPGVSAELFKALQSLSGMNARVNGMVSFRIETLDKKIKEAQESDRPWTPKRLARLECLKYARGVFEDFSKSRGGLSIDAYLATKFDEASAKGKSCYEWHELLSEGKKTEKEGWIVGELNDEFIFGDLMKLVDEFKEQKEFVTKTLRTSDPKIIEREYDLANYLETLSLPVRSEKSAATILEMLMGRQELFEGENMLVGDYQLDPKQYYFSLGRMSHDLKAYRWDAHDEARFRACLEFKLK